MSNAFLPPLNVADFPDLPGCVCDWCANVRAKREERDSKKPQGMESLSILFPDLVCAHDWRVYRGAMTVDEYCSKCSEKRPFSGTIKENP